MAETRFTRNRSKSSHMLRGTGKYGRFSHAPGCDRLYIVFRHLTKDRGDASHTGTSDSVIDDACGYFGTNGDQNQAIWHMERGGVLT